MKTNTLALLLGILISLALFWLMQTMISNNPQQFSTAEDLQMTEFVRLKRETKAQVKEREIPDQPEPEKRPPPPKMEMQQVQVTQSDAPALDVPRLDIPLQTQQFNGGVLSGVAVAQNTRAMSTNVIPLVRIPPRYPMRAASRRIEGWVKVEFTIDKEGAVKDAIVVEAEPKNIFDRSALQAIKRWKFKAKIVDGIAFEQRAVQILQFRLSN